MSIQVIIMYCLTDEKPERPRPQRTASALHVGRGGPATALVAVRLFGDNSTEISA